MHEMDNQSAFVLLVDQRAQRFMNDCAAHSTLEQRSGNTLFRDVELLPSPVRYTCAAARHNPIPHQSLAAATQWPNDTATRIRCTLWLELRDRSVQRPNFRIFSQAHMMQAESIARRGLGTDNLSVAFLLIQCTQHDSAVENTCTHL